MLTSRVLCTVFTYDVVFKSSPVRWASRWDTYLQTQDREIHWFSVVNSMMILLFLSGMVAMIMIRTLRRDITQYNQLETVEETAEETGWKLVHGDVFRPPPAPGALSVCIGTGSQLLGMTFVTMVFAVLAALSTSAISLCRENRVTRDEFERRASAHLLEITTLIVLLLLVLLVDLMMACVLQFLVAKYGREDDHELELASLVDKEEDDEDDEE